jgi:hypothetical protein
MAQRSRSSSASNEHHLDRDGAEHADENCLLPTEKMSVTEPAPRGRMRGRGMKKQTAASRMPGIGRGQLLMLECKNIQ